ncbi:hypothetical protein Tco_0804805 [Tanacetum coccineum]|uniref:Copia protein n=1 Tax=Tanacetum coccineum TaxID=301880 RepID=A0ABQ5A987_9ASTR
MRYQSLIENKGKTSSKVEPDTKPLQIQTFADIQAFLLFEDELDKKSDEEEVLAAGEDMNADTQVGVEVRTPSPKQDQPEPSHVQESASDFSSPDLKKFDNTIPLTERQLIKYLRKMSRVLFSRITKTLWEQHEEAAVSYTDLKASIKTYYDENIAHRYQTDKLIEASMSSLDKSSTATSDLYKGLNIITQLLKEIKTDVKDDPAMNKKIMKPLRLLPRSLLILLRRSFNSYWGETDVSKQGKLNEPPHSTDANIEFIGSSTPQPSITQAQPITIINPKPIVPQRKGKGIATDEQVEDQRKLVSASSIVHPDPDEPVRVEFMINGRMVYLTEQEIQNYWDKEEQIKKVEEEARLLATSKPEVIKVVRKKSKKLEIHPKEAISTKAGEKFKKAQDVEHEVLKRQHTEKVKKSLKLGKQKHIELEPEVKVPGLECNRSLPEGVPFVNNMVIEELEYVIFFTDVFGDQAFQRWNDIHKVGVDSLVSYLVMASMVKTKENARFSLMLKKLIADHPD